MLGHGHPSAQAVGLDFWFYRSVRAGKVLRLDGGVMLCWECCTFGEVVVAATIRDGDIQGMLYPERAVQNS